MRAGIFRTPRFRVVAPVLLALLATLTPSASAQSLFKYAPATQWGYTFAGPAANSPSAPVPKGANLEKQSTINVNYINFPDWAKKELQSAVDIWAANFQSKVVITIDATWSTSQSISIASVSIHLIISHCISPNFVLYDTWSYHPLDITDIQ